MLILNTGGTIYKYKVTKQPTEQHEGSHHNMNGAHTSSQQSSSHESSHHNMNGAHILLVVISYNSYLVYSPLFNTKYN